MIKQLWPTPFLQTSVADAESFNARFEQYVLARRADDEGVTRSNVGGWHSNDDLMQWPFEGIDQLKTWILDGVRRIMEACTHPEAGHRKVDFQLVAWANVATQGNFHVIHSHPNSSWSGVYYVSTGEPSISALDRGPIVFSDPRSGINQFNWPGNPFDEMVRIDPQPGMLLIFPSWLKHFVYPFRGQTQRISISFNFVIEENETAGDDPAD